MRNTSLSVSGNDSAAVINDLEGTINLVLPSKSDITKVKLDIATPDGVVVTPSSGSTVDLSSPILSL